LSRQGRKAKRFGLKRALLLIFECLALMGVIFIMIYAFVPTLALTDEEIDLFSEAEGADRLSVSMALLFRHDWMFLIFTAAFIAAFYIFNRVDNLRTYRSSAYILTGILGTFLGITLVLPDLERVFANVRTIDVTGVRTAMGNIGLAFRTSVVGVFMGLLSGAIEHHLVVEADYEEGEVEIEGKAPAEEVERAAAPLAAGDLKELMTSSTSNLTEAISIYTEDLKEQVVSMQQRNEALIAQLTETTKKLEEVASRVSRLLYILTASAQKKRGAGQSDASEKKDAG